MQSQQPERKPDDRRPPAQPEDDPRPKTVEQVLEKVNKPEQPTPTQAEADDIKERLMGQQPEPRRDEHPPQQQPQPQPAQPQRRDVQGEHGPGYQTR